MAASRGGLAGGSACLRSSCLSRQVLANEIALYCPLEVPVIVPRAGRWLACGGLDKSAHCFMVEFGNSVEFGNQTGFHPTGSSLKSVHDNF